MVQPEIARIPNRDCFDLEDLFDQNANYKAEQFAPGLLIFGSDGGGEAFAFDMRFDPPPVVAVPFVPMDIDDAIRIAPSFDDFMDKAARCPLIC